MASGRKSSADFGLDTFGIGTTMACRRIVGKYLSSKDLLKIVVVGWYRWTAIRLRKSVDRLSTPVASFSLNFDSWSKVRSGKQALGGELSKLLSNCLGWKSAETGGHFVAQCLSIAVAFIVVQKCKIVRDIRRFARAIVGFDVVKTYRIYWNFQWFCKMWWKLVK